MKVVIAGGYPVDENRIPGGIEAAIYYTVEKLHLMRGIEIDVVSCSPYSREECTIVKQDNVRIHHIPEVNP